MMSFFHKTTKKDQEIMCEDSIANIHAKMKAKYSVPLPIQVAHYTPTTFPLVPMISPETNQLCKDSWQLIIAKREETESGFELNGITLFYNDFYERLTVMDENKRIEGVLAAHTAGINQIAEKGAIIIRIINYVLSLKENSEVTQFRLYALGKAHAARKIRPYMYSIFVQTLLYTIAAQLGVYASQETMEAWVNSFAFIMRSMLPIAIKNQTAETEMFINTKTAFHSDNMKAQVLEAKLESHLNSSRSNCTGSYSHRSDSTCNTSGYNSNRVSGRVAVTNAPFNSTLVSIVSGCDLAGLVDLA